MAIYEYKGLDRTGKEVKASLNSEGINQAKTKIKSMGIMLIDIKEKKSGASKDKSSFSFGGSIKVEELALFTRQLATLAKAKIQIVEALGALMDQTDHPKLKVILSEIRGKVNEGTSLAKAFGDYPKVFDNVYVNMVEAGEQSGNLEIVLLRLADFTEAQTKLKNQIKGAITYPVIMVIIGMLMFGIIFTVVIPKITKIFETMDKALPWTTQLCIWISDFLLNYWYMVIIGMFASYYFFMKYINTPKGKAWWHRTLLRMPIIGELTTMINVSRFCSTLATLMGSGVPILTAMSIVKNIIANVHMARAVDEAKVLVKEGGSMATPLKASGYYPTMVTHMITLGEKSGELEPMLKIVSDNYEDQVNNKLSGLTSVLEPIMMVGMGLAVGFIVFSVVIPMMELNSFNR
ncbi:MAG: type II secretion system protein GspF [Halobacteriovoraceae bacterium]|nr:type II secretion system protein GspF [Halobacteriovoraceae bacterium]MBC97681.1 type II secretion system protein GspF [Halobacteriovoraceae bacterium]|tara:strand:+ start:89526 stop:90740 length:1215 start_codon:yes stop_codon:yes gene_type:complete